MGANPSCRSSEEEHAGSAITKEAASSKSKGKTARKAPPQKPSSKASQWPRRVQPSLPRALPSNRSRGAEILQGRVETGAGPTPLAAPSAKPSPCQRRAGPKPHVPEVAAAGPNPSTAEEAPVLPCHSSALGATQGRSRRRLSEPLQPAKVTASSITRRGVQGTSSTGTLAQDWRSQSLPLRTNSACRIREQSLPGAASRSWEREEKPLGVTAPLGMPGGRIPPPTPTPGLVMSWLSSPMP